VSDKVDFKPKLVRKDKKGHLRLIKGAINQEEIIINLYAYSVGTPIFLNIHYWASKHR
jgi:hypothetical protein